MALKHGPCSVTLETLREKVKLQPHFAMMSGRVPCAMTTCVSQPPRLCDDPANEHKKALGQAWEEPGKVRGAPFPAAQPELSHTQHALLCGRLKGIHRTDPLLAASSGGCKRILCWRLKTLFLPARRPSLSWLCSAVATDTCENSAGI